MPPRAIPAAVRRELEERFQAQNAMLEQMMKMIQDITPPAPVNNGPPEPDVPEQQNPQQAPVPHLLPPVAERVPEVPQEAPFVGEPVYERFRRQKPPRFDGTHDPALAEEWIKKL